MLPAKTFPVAIYLASLIQSANTPAPVVTAFYSIKFYHEIAGFISPTDSSLVTTILEAAKRKLSKPIVKKEPVTIELLNSIYLHLYCDGNIYNQRITCALLVSFAGYK